MLRSIGWIILTALAALWIYFGTTVEAADRSHPVHVAERGEGLSASTINNEGVRLYRNRRYGDAVAHFERAHDFAPSKRVYIDNLERARNRRRYDAWENLLGPATGLSILLFVASTFAGVIGRRRRRRALKRLRLRGDPWIDVSPEDKQAELSLKFTEPVSNVVRDHPLTIVWSSSAHGKHMKSKPPVVVDGKKARVKLDGPRLERLRRYPGHWKGFLYLGKTQVGEAVARVG